MATAIRDYLKSRGLADNQITYDNGTVFAKGKRFVDATPQADGRTYADASTLENAYNNYDMSNQIAELRTRAQTPSTELTGLQQTIKDRINRPAQQFSYDAQSDPQYQNALQQARQNAQTAGNNAMVALGSRGIGNSSITGDRVAQIQQKELGNVTANVLPQLSSQAYQRYQGQQQADNAQTGQMFQLAGMYDNQDQQQYARLAQALGLQRGNNQQQFQNQQTTDQATRQRQQDHIALAQTLTDRYGVQVNPTEDPSQSYAQVQGLTPVAYQQYLQQKAVQDAGLTGQYNGQETMDARKMAADMADRQAQLGISRMNAGTSAASASNSAGNAAFGRLMDIWQATGQAPEGIPGVAPGTPLAGKQAAVVPTKDSADNYSTIIGDLGSEGVTKSQARQLAQANKPYLSDADYRKLLDYIDKEF